MEFAQNVDLAPYTTFRIGGPARWFAEATTEEDIARSVSFARERRLRLFVLGGGSNLLVSDRGFDGLVLRVALRGIAHEDCGNERRYSVAAGEDWDTFVAQTVEQGCAGVECLSGIPGTVGGTPVQNVGAYGQEVSETIGAVRVLDCRTLRFLTLNNSECGFSYRRSLFNTGGRGLSIVTRVDYVLGKHGAPTIVYEDLKRAFCDRRPTLAAVRETVRSIRARKGMLIVPGDRESQSAGSFFKNPVVPSSALPNIAAALGVEQDDIPRYPAGDGQVKLPAAWLLERTGFTRGFSLGNAGISSRHTLALVNRGSARAGEVIALRDKILDAVEAKIGFRLEQEPVWVE